MLDMAVMLPIWKEVVGAMARMYDGNGRREEKLEEAEVRSILY